MNSSVDSAKLRKELENLRVLQCITQTERQNKKWNRALKSSGAALSVLKISPLHVSSGNVFLDHSFFFTWMFEILLYICATQYQARHLYVEFWGSIFLHILLLLKTLPCNVQLPQPPKSLISISLNQQANKALFWFSSLSGLQGLYFQFLFSSVCNLYCLMSNLSRQLFYIFCLVFNLFMVGGQDQSLLLQHFQKQKIPIVFLCLELYNQIL